MVRIQTRPIHCRNQLQANNLRLILTIIAMTRLHLAWRLQQRQMFPKHHVLERNLVMEQVITIRPSIRRHVQKTARTLQKQARLGQANSLKSSTEAMLQEMAFVLQMTRRVREAMSVENSN